MGFSVAAFLANQGRKVSVVFDKADAVIASKTPVPEFIRKSRYVVRTATMHVPLSSYDRLMSILSPHAELNTGLE